MKKRPWSHGSLASPPKHPGHQLGISRRKRRRHGDGGMGSLWAESCSRLDQNWPAWLDGWMDGWMDGWIISRQVSLKVQLSMLFLKCSSYSYSLVTAIGYPWISKLLHSPLAALGVRRASKTALVSKKVAEPRPGRGNGTDFFWGTNTSQSDWELKRLKIHVIF